MSSLDGHLLHRTSRSIPPVKTNSSIAHCLSSELVLKGFQPLIDRINRKRHSRASETHLQRLGAEKDNCTFARLISQDNFFFGHGNLKNPDYSFDDI